MSQLIVAETKSDLLARGFPFQTNCDAAAITFRVAWKLRAQGAMLVGKRPEQNHCEHNGVRYAVDVIAFPSGWVDILGSAGPPANSNNPQWNPTGTDPSAPLFPPFDLDAHTEPPPPPPPPPGSDWIGPFVAELTAAGAAAIQQGQALQNAARILAEQASTAL